GSSVDRRLAADAAELDVTARALDLDAATELREAQVARRDLRLERAEAPTRVDVGRRGRDLDVRTVRRLDAQDDVAAVEEDPEAAPIALDVDHQLVPPSALTQLDTRVLDHLAHLLACVRGVELDGRLLAVHCLQLDLPGGKPEIELERSRRVEGLAPHRRDPLIGRRRGLRGSRLSTRYSMCPNSAGKNS